MAAIASEEVRALIRRADLIWGVDVRDLLRERPSLFFGKALLEEGVLTGRTIRGQALLFALDFASDRLEYLCAAVQVLKGSCCYEEVGVDPRAS